MRPSRVLAKLRQGQVASCTKMNISDSRVAEIGAMSGVDSIWLCQEHCGNTLNDLEHQIHTAKIYNVDTIVRVQRGNYSNLIRPLELDAAGIIVPHVMSADDARAVVRWTRFYPLGRRPLDGGNADAAYCRIPGPQYIEEANRERLIIIQIEDPEPMEELEEIAAVEGVDMLFFGPADYSHSLGIPFQFDHAAVKEARQKIAEAAARHGKFAGTMASPDSLCDLVDEGYHFLCMGADVLILTEGFNAVAESFRQVTSIETFGPGCETCKRDVPG